MENYKRRGCLPFRSIARTKVEAVPDKGMGINQLRCIRAWKSGKKVVDCWLLVFPALALVLLFSVLSSRL